MRREGLEDERAYYRAEAARALAERRAGEAANAAAVDALRADRDGLRRKSAAGDAAGRAAGALLETRDATIATLTDTFAAYRGDAEASEAIHADRHAAAEAAAIAKNDLFARAEIAGRARAYEADEAAGACRDAAVALQALEDETYWRESLRASESRAEDREAAAWKGGMEERDKLARKEASDLRAAAERALADVKAAAAASLTEVRVNTKAALEKAAAAATQRERDAVARADEAARGDERGLRFAAEAAAAAAGAAQLDNATRALERDARREKRVAEEHARREADRAEAERLRLSTELGAVREHAILEFDRAQQLRSEHALALEGQADAAERALRHALRDAADASDAAESGRVAGGAEAAAAAREERDADQHEALTLAVARATAAAEVHCRDTLLAPVRLALLGADAARAADGAMLAEAARAWDDEHDKVVDLRGELHYIRRSCAIREWRIGVRAVATNAKAIAARERAEKDRDASEAKLVDDLDRAKRKAASVRRQLDAKLDEGEGFRRRMHDTLVNHERATLVAHKRRSTELGQELEIIVRDRDDLETERDKLLEYIDEMQESVRAIEQSIHAHSKSSAISSDGRINIAHAKKKKRMDDDHEMLLLGVEKQRGALADTDKKLANLNDARENKEDEMKALERRLVELLVSQQKKLLAILQEAANASRAVDEATPRKPGEEKRDELELAEARAAAMGGMGDFASPW